jgi:signal transduction histidine kinase
MVLIAVPALGLVLYGNLEQRWSETARVRQGAVAISQLAAANEEHLIQNARQLLATLTEFPFLVLATNREFCRENFSNLRKLSPDYVNFGLIEANGTVFCSAQPTNAAINLEDRAYFQRTVQTRDFSIGEFQVGRLTGTPALNFGYPVFDTNGGLKRVVYASLRASRLSDALKHIRLPSGSTIILVDRKGNVLARQPELENWVGKPLYSAEVVRRALAGREGVFEMPGIDSVSSLHAVTPIADGGAASLCVIVGIPLTVSFARANAILVRNFIVLGVAVAAILVAARFYATSFFLNPIGALVTTAGRLAEGDLSARAGVIQGSTELTQLGLAFDEMAERLEKRQTELSQAHEQITRLNQDLERRVLERTAQLEAMNKELEAFSYSVSHDLRAPLRHIEGYVGLLGKAKDSGLPEQESRYLGRIADASRQMSRLIDDLLLFSRMGRAELRKTDCDLRRLVEDTIQTFQDETSGRHIVWDIGALPRVNADPNLLRQVLVNLLANAIKFTRPRDPAEIQIGCDVKNPDETVLFIRDNGVGFDMEYADKLFGVFQRLHLEDEFEGTGIGLANVGRIIARHGGRVWAEGKVSRGATFYFSLPNRDQANPS